MTRPKLMFDDLCTTTIGAQGPGYEAKPQHAQGGSIAPIDPVLSPATGLKLWSSGQGR